MPDLSSFKTRRSARKLGRLSPSRSAGIFEERDQPLPKTRIRNSFAKTDYSRTTRDEIHSPISHIEASVCCFVLGSAWLIHARPSPKICTRAASTRNTDSAWRANVTTQTVSTPAPARSASASASSRARILCRCDKDYGNASCRCCTFARVRHPGRGTATR
ncbi:unnamed protein product [Mycena citricolor]|uniref:Uncharacterized protein n=1 Tax=Mycena citricolor TaxID=2018698 RepID=A0AAD2Q1P0_9AGAR|nr:unnamed protein product [Mycena citricolor]